MPRGNPNKLIPMNKRTKQEQSQIASAGGKASGVARARAKAFREKIDDIFSDDDFGTLLLELKKDYKNANPSQKVQILS